VGTDRAALVTGGSSGIGLAIARALGEDGYDLTISARRPEKLEAAADELRSAGLDPNAVAANMAEEGEIEAVFDSHREKFGRLDVLVNNAGVGIGGELAGYPTKRLDLQLDVNLRAVMIGTSLGLPLLREAGSEHGKALIVNTASVAGKVPQPWVSIYSATKAGVIGFSGATQKEVADDGIQVTALCPGFVDTPMTDYAKEAVGAEEMIRPEDIAESVRFLLRTSPNCLVPEVVFTRPGEVAAGGV
jgi:NAD(P)-dependent dehydrogenase (short-subunit alcohol dehydrogenase family)